LLLVRRLSEFGLVADGAKLREVMTNTLFRETSSNVGYFGGACQTPDELRVFFQPQWYAAYTRANHERRVAHELAERGVESFLPQYESVRKWKDRDVMLSIPLFPGYVFVHVALQDKLGVLQIPGVASLVGFAGKPAAIPAEELERIRLSLQHNLRATPHPYLTVGRRVRVRSGAFEGLEGIVVRRNNRNRLVISLDLIQRSIAVELGEASLEVLR
jgi:transcription antitermination factor NusG